ncbi:MAG: DUF1028 domain-containing protein [candidate division Zixibacteria bacterium]|nr:DUF1028 domain-containing protein [candidate division Zixibacteria bacterium]
MRKILGFGLILNVLLGGVVLASRVQSPPPVATFSIVAYDPVNGELGVAVQSKFFAVGTVVPWAKAGVGAVATQSYANTTYGPRGLEMLEAGISPQEVMDSLTRSDEMRARRQAGIIDAKGNAVTYTGDSCLAWAGGKTGKYYACQGNILVSQAVVDAMAAAYEASRGELAERLLTAMEAGQRQGGDSRGMQSMALLVVKDQGGYSGYTDRYIDLRVDDAPDPFKEMRRLLHIQQGIKHLQIAGRYYRDKNLEAAVKEAEQAVLADATNADCHYDYACYLSLSGKKEDALVALKKALQLNPKMSDLAKKDGDLSNIRPAASFSKMVEEAEAKAGKK